MKFYTILGLLAGGIFTTIFSLLLGGFSIRGGVEAADAATIYFVRLGSGFFLPILFTGIGLWAAGLYYMEKFDPTS